MTAKGPASTSEDFHPSGDADHSIDAFESKSQRLDDTTEAHFDATEQQVDREASQLPLEEPAFESAVEQETLEVSHDQHTPVQIQPLDHEESRTSEDDDGDISLVASPRMDNTASFGSSSHRRIDSMPPQKYDVDAASGLSASLASASLHSTIEEEEADLSVPQYDESASSSVFRSQFPTSQHDEHSDYLMPTIDKADLNFVDITLDGPADTNQLGGNMLEPPNPLARSTRTAEQIRRDSVSSQKLPAGTSEAPSQSEPAPPRVHASADELSPPRSPDHGDQRHAGRRSIEGRYRGRRSGPSSRAASPTRYPSPSPPDRTSFAPSRAHDSTPPASVPAQNGFTTTPAPVLLAADEDGNISVVSDLPVSPRTLPQAVPQEMAGGESLQAQDRAAEAPSQNASSAQFTQQRPSIQNHRAAASIPDEVAAADAVKTFEPPAMEHSSQDSSLPDGKASTSSAPGLSDKADQFDAKSRRKSSFAASTDPVESRTRMTTLPAKPKTEEMKHRADFERMMMAAKEGERKKREEEEERKRRRQDEQHQALGRWEKEILPSWSRARKDPELARLWWKGAPPSIRGRVWALAIGNPLMLPRNLLEQSEKKPVGKKDKRIEQIIPPRVLDQIDEDVQETLPSLKLFQANGPLHDDLIRLCRAFVLVRMEQVAELDVAGDADKAASRYQNASPLSRNVELPPISGVQEQAEPQDEYEVRGIDIYQPGLASLAAVLLVNMSINTAFIALLNLLHSKPWLKALYSLLPTVLPRNQSQTKKPSLVSASRGSAFTLAPKEKQIRGFERVLETLLADQMPKVYANFLARNVKLYRVVLRDWVSTLWSRWLDVDTVMRLWDAVLLDETDSMIYRVCLALVQTLESRLYVPDQEELESVLKGTSKAAIAIWRRDKDMRGELEVHAKCGLAAPRHSRNSISNAAVEASSPLPTVDGSESCSLASETASSSVSEAKDLPTITGATPPPRSSSLSQPHSQQSHVHLPHPSTSVEESSPEIDSETIMPRDYIYEQYAIREETVFDTLEAQQSWWKQSTLQRLLDRELSE
ncbi:uncharacterized protein MEPE_03651 [Melanopsichium pennsylvanicum]|uniref:Rab-GAP TBC domain-containing protein n=2 Tax=Melanopsichium pennsylvanicum TaxID=63383 RepID=A0AAJ4XN88_9BASI|nr:conserved hypothetical protein [Melanopsichium pennsylvanicum 4]SNX84942.1 uncharacterized protein MEPE_03651 [Melanopsichium pennsylvanicum]